MRRPNRRPNYTEMDDITNWEETAKYVIVLDGTTYKAYNGNTGEIDSSSTSAHTVIQYAFDTGGAGTVSLKCDVTLTANIKGTEYNILEGNYHTIIPSVSFDMLTMDRHFMVRNVRFDVTGIVFAHACIVFDGEDQYVAGGVDQMQRATVSNCDGYSETSQGTFISYICSADSEDIAWTLVENTSSRLFEYGLKIVATVGTSFINGNRFQNMMGYGDKYFVYIEEGATNAISRNRFDMHYQRRDETDTVFTIDGGRNYFWNTIWDITAAETSYLFSASSLHNYVFDMSIDLARVTDNGTNNMIFNVDTEGYIGGTDFNFFEKTLGNPSVRIYGDVAGTEKYASLGISAAGYLLISKGTVTDFRIDAGGVLSLNRSANGQIRCYDNSGTDENEKVIIYGRNNADTGTEHLDLRWGDGTHEDGEIETSSGDLRLSPAGVVMFGTKTGGGDVVSDGYISIKDAAGNAVKLMTTA